LRLFSISVTVRKRDNKQFFSMDVDVCDPEFHGNYVVDGSVFVSDTVVDEILRNS